MSVHPVHPAAPHHLPWFITAPGETDGMMVAMALVLVASMLMIGILFLRIHSLPERMAHKGKKLQFEIVAVLCLLALFTHVHLFWVAALLLAFIDIPDLGGPLGRMAGSLEAIASASSGERAEKQTDEIGPPTGERATAEKSVPEKKEVRRGERKAPLHA
jgi:hypothetical protein